MWCNPDDERCAYADSAGDSTPAAFLNEPTAMVACRRGGGGRRPSATTLGTRLAMGFNFSSASVMCKRLSGEPSLGIAIGGFPIVFILN
jgi:hypothetical protein